MEVHVGKSHSEIKECGLCEYEAKDSENLNLHLATCEINQMFLKRLDYSSEVYIEPKQ